LYQPDFTIAAALPSAISTATATAVAPIKRTPDLLLVLARSRRGFNTLGAPNLSTSATPFSNRASQAAWRTWHANNRAEFHHGLIEVTGPGFIQKRLRGLPGLSRIQIDAGHCYADHCYADQSLQHTLDVAIDYGYGLGKGDAGDGGGGVASDSRQFEQGFGISRERATVLLRHFLRATVQHARAAIVAEAAPGSQHSIFGSGGQRLHIRKEFEKNSIVVKNGSHARLLQHNFAEPNAVGIVSFAPGKIAAMPVVPAEESAPEWWQVLAGQEVWRRDPPLLYGDSVRAHYCWLTLCAIATHPDFCCCQTVIMCCGVEGRGCAPPAPFKLPFRVMV
jgi:hypothetical protein